MLRPMFGMGGSEIVVILIVALLFLGPEKLPQAAKTLSKGIRDIKRQSRSLQQTIENDDQIGGAIRDLKSALRGEDAPARPRKPKPPKALTEPAAVSTDPALAALAAGASGHGPGCDHDHGEPHPETEGAAAPSEATDAAAPSEATTKSALTLPPTAGEPDPGAPAETAKDDAELRAMIRPAGGTVAKGTEPDHG